MSQFNVNEVISEVANDINDAIDGGFRRLGDLLQEKLAEGGAQEAAGFEVTINGASQLFISDSDPRLNQQVQPEQVQIRKVNSATAGC